MESTGVRQLSRSLYSRVVSYTNWASFFKIALIVAALLNLETVWQTIANYSFGELPSYTSPLQVFGGLALGKVIGILFLQKKSLAEKFFLSLLLVCIAWIGLIYIPQLFFLWLTLPFVGFGILLVDLFSTEPLVRLIVASGLVGTIYFAIFPFITGLLSEELVVISLLLLLVALFLEAQRKWSVVSIALLIGVTLLWHNNVLEIPSNFDRSTERFQDSKELMEPQVNLLFRTDLLELPSIDRNVLVMNGSRFMVLPTKWQIEEKLAEPFNVLTPAYDTPYHFGKRFEKVLVIGPAGGKNILTALAYEADSVTGVDINPAVFYFLRDQRPNIIENLYLDPRVTTVRMEGRNFLETTDEKFDLIVLQGVQTGTQLQNTSAALLESFLFTQEALDVMWERLEEGGAIFFDEFDHETSYSRGKLNSLGLIAEERLPITNADQQIFFYRYRQDGENPMSADQRRARAGLILWKDPITNDPATLKTTIEQLFDLDFKKLDATGRKSISDNHPVFVQELGTRISVSLMILGCILTFFGALFFMRRYSPTEKTSSFHSVNAGLVFLGSAYILCVMSFWGPIVLLTGEPFVAGPLVYFGLYFFGLLGGLVALRLRNFSVRTLFIIGGAGVLLAWLLTMATKSLLLGSNDVPLRYLVAVIPISLLALCFELPYIIALRSVEHIRRGEAYTYEALGTLLGASISLVAQPAVGFSGSLFIGVLFLACAGYFFYRGKNTLENSSSV